MRSSVRLIALIVCGFLAFPDPSNATCGSSLVPTANVASSDSRLFGIGGSSGSDIWAVGAFGPPGNFSALQTLVEHSTGSTWSIVTSPNYPGSSSDRLVSVTAVSPKKAWAVGVWSKDGGNTHQLTERWDGKSWTVLQSNSIDELDGVSAVSGDPTSVWTVGERNPSNCRVPQGCNVPVAKHWNVAKNRWDDTSVPAGQIGVGSLAAVVSLAGGSAWAVGLVEHGSLLKPAPFVVHWTGSSWTAVPNAVGNGFLSSIAASSDNDVWVAGNVTNSLGYAIDRFAEHWNGAAWTVYKFPHYKDAFNNAIAEGPTGDAWVASIYYPLTDTVAQLPRLEHYDGTSWSVIPTPANGLLSGQNAFYETPLGVLSVGSAVPSKNYDVITYGTLSHC